MRSYESLIWSSFARNSARVVYAQCLSMSDAAGRWGMLVSDMLRRRAVDSGGAGWAQRPALLMNCQVCTRAGAQARGDATGVGTQRQEVRLPSRDHACESRPAPPRNGARTPGETPPSDSHFEKRISALANFCAEDSTQQPPKALVGRSESRRYVSLRRCLDAPSKPPRAHQSHPSPATNAPREYRPCRSDARPAPGQSRRSPAQETAGDRAPRVLISRLDVRLLFARRAEGGG